MVLISVSHFICVDTQKVCSYLSPILNVELPAISFRGSASSSYTLTTSPACGPQSCSLTLSLPDLLCPLPALWRTPFRDAVVFLFLCFHLGVRLARRALGLRSRAPAVGRMPFHGASLLKMSVTCLLLGPHCCRPSPASSMAVL